MTELVGVAAAACVNRQPSLKVKGGGGLHVPHKMCCLRLLTLVMWDWTKTSQNSVNGVQHVIQHLSPEHVSPNQVKFRGDAALDK